MSTGPSGARAALAARGKTRVYKKGTIVIDEGDSGDTVYIILSGRVKVLSTDPDGREIVYRILDPGDYFGEMSLDGGTRSATVITMEQTECAVVTSAVVREFMAENPDFAFELLVTAIGRAREATRIARGLALGGVYSRLKDFLERNAVAHEDGTWLVEERLTHQDIAARIGCGREMVSRILKDLETGEYVEMRNRHIAILRKLPEKW